MASVVDVISRPFNLMIAIGFGAAVGAAAYCLDNSKPVGAAAASVVAAAIGVAGYREQNRQTLDEIRSNAPRAF